MSSTTTITSPTQGDVAQQTAAPQLDTSAPEPSYVAEPAPSPPPAKSQAAEGSALIGQAPPAAGASGTSSEPASGSEPPAAPVAQSGSEPAPPPPGKPVTQAPPVEQKPPVTPSPKPPVEQKPPIVPTPRPKPPVVQTPPVEQRPPVVVQPPRPRRPRPVRPTPVQHSPVQQTPIQTGGGSGTSRVTLSNRDRNSSVRLQSDRGTMVEIFGDPHVRANVNGVRRTFDIGYGPGSITLKDGTKVSWDTYPNRSRALRNFAIDAPGRGRDNKVSTADGKDVSNQPTNLSDAQLREFISKLSEFRGNWREPLRRRPGTALDTSPNTSGEARGKHVVKRGDTLWAIARSAGLSVEQVASYNKIRNPNLIHPGQVIKLPG